MINEAGIRKLLAQGEGIQVELKTCRDALNRDVYESVCAFLNRSGEEGFTLAAILLLGKDEVLLSVLPHHRTDAILRRENLDRYDDRDDIRTNLMESYERLMAFTAKHLSDHFYLEGDQRVSLRDHIFHEVAANILIHREFLDAFPAKLVIEKGRVITENSNKPHGHGLIDPASFSPFPKNPVIARFFKEIGWADELGSGVRNLFRFSKAYSGQVLELTEGDIFKIEVATPVEASDQATGEATGEAEREKRVLEFCQCARSVPEIMEYLELTHREYFRIEILNPMIEKGLLKLTVPDKPTSPKQKYYAPSPEKKS